jgi:hypothetical protein
MLNRERQLQEALARGLLCTSDHKDRIILEEWRFFKVVSQAEKPPNVRQKPFEGLRIIR